MLVGSASGWHFRLAAGVFVAIAAGEVAGQALRGPVGTGAW